MDSDLEIMIDEYINGRCENKPHDNTINKICCGVEMFEHPDDARLVCHNCGISIIYNLFISDNKPNKIVYKKNIYKAVNHFLDKLREINGEIIPVKNIEWLQLYKNMNCSNIYIMRDILKPNHKKLFKYIYFFYNTKNKTNLIKINNTLKTKLIKIFIKFNNVFKRIYKRKNMLNYHYLIYRFCLNYGINLKNKLFIPKLKMSLVHANETYENVIKYLNDSNESLF